MDDGSGVIILSSQMAHSVSALRYGALRGGGAVRKCVILLLEREAGSLCEKAATAEHMT